MSDDGALLAASRAVYMEEAGEMIDQFEQALLALESDPSDPEQLNAAFRAAHTIKGSSGLFGFNAVVRYTHEVEAVMDAMRLGRVPADSRVIALLLQARDRIAAMIDELAAGAPEATAADEAALSALRTLLAAGSDDSAAADGQTGSGTGLEENVAADAAGAGPTAVDAATSALATIAEIAADGRADGSWHVSLRFKTDALRNGFDPLSFIRYLPRVGAVERIVTLTQAVPALAMLDPEACYLGYEIRLSGPTDRAVIEGVFEFARDDCTLNILPPGARIDAYVRLIESYGESDETEVRLGDVLVAVGALTAAERDALLARQRTLAREATLQPTPRLGELAVAHGAAAPVVVQAAVARQERLRDRRSEDARSIRVAAEKLDRLIDLIGELVIASSSARLVAQQEGSSRFAEAAFRIESLVQAGRDGALQLRMVQIGETFARFQRVVRDTARALGKDIELELTGGDTELDKAIVEQISDPLMHLVRNSLDHGLETPAERVAAGKPARGRLVLNAFHDAGSIVIDVRDDGRGLDRDRILAKAIARGLVAEGQVPDDEEIHQLIFSPGFSTAEQVTDISGRGVGMDVVRRNIEALRGTVRLATTRGAGTTTRIRLPLTLAIIDGFLVGVGASHYIIPLERVVECIERPATYRPADDGCSGHFELRGEALPCLDVRALFAVAGEPATDTRPSTVVVGWGESKVGLVVDRLMGEHQTVIKPLGALFGELDGIGGSTILGSGEVALILDVPALVERRMRARRARPPLPSRGAARAEAAAC